MFAQKTKLQLCARNLVGVEHDLVDVTFPTVLVGAVNNGAGYAVGSTAITVDGFSGGNIPTGCVIGFAGDDTTYYVSTGGSSTAITIDPPLKVAVLDNVVVTIYPHFDITQYWTNDVTLEQQAEFTQAELVLDKPLRIELFNKNSVFYDRDTHSTGWGLTTSYFSTYNAQGSTDNQYIRISLKRNGTWYQKYNGKIKQSTLEIDEINHTVSFETESVFYGLKDALVSQITDLYNLHKYTTSTRKTKTPSGKYVDVIRSLFKYVGVMPREYTVTHVERTYNGDTYLHKVTIGAHNIIPGELFTISTGNKQFDGTHIAYSVTSTTVTFVFDSVYDYVKDDVNATVAAGGSSVVLQAGLGSDYNGFSGKCKFATSDTTIYNFTYTHSTKTIALTPVLSDEATINEDVYLSFPKLTASTATSGTVTAHRIFFDTSGGRPTHYFDVTHQGHTYNLLDLFWITEKWMVQDVEAETGFDLLKELCLQLGAVPCIDYVSGIAYGFFRSKINASSSKVTLTQSKIIGEPRLRGNWAFYSADGVLCNSQVSYWNNESQMDEFCYAEDLGAGDYQRYLSETPVSTVLAYAKYSSSICADSFNNLTVNDQIKFRNHDTIYTITAVSGETITIKPELSVSVKLGEKFHKITNNGISIKYSNCFNIKLKYPNIFVADSATNTIRKFWNNGTATLGIHPMSYYTSATLYDANASLTTIRSCCFIKNKPVADGQLFRPNGDLLAIIVDDASYSYVRSVKSNINLPATGIYELQDPQVVTGLGKLVHGYIKTRDADNNSVSIFSVLMTAWNPTVGVDLQIGRISLDMDSYGEEATARKIIIDEIKRKRVGDSRFAGNFTDSTETVTVRKGSSSSTAFANEFDLYRLSQRFYTQVFLATMGSYPGLIGTGSTVYSMCLNADVLNPDYDDLIYADANHAECIQKAMCFSPTTASEVLTGTPPTAGTVRNFIVNHGEGANQEYYYCLSSSGNVLINDGTAWTDSSDMLGGVLGGVSNYSLWGGTYPSRNHSANVKIIRKAYDNFFVVADPTDIMLLVHDEDNNRMIYIEDTTNLDAIDDIDIQCFTNWYDYQGATNSTIFENDVCFNASKLAYKFYSKNRRPYDVQVRDADLGYINYTLFDRVTIDSSILSKNGGGSPLFYVYGYRIDCRTHDHKLTLLESVE